jgi:hypothetical protein
MGVGEGVKDSKPIESDFTGSINLMELTFFASIFSWNEAFQ